MTKLPISVFIIARNEADRLPLVIRSVRDWVDEVHVIDSGSDDDTIKVSEALGAPVGEGNLNFDLANGDAKAEIRGRLSQPCVAHRWRAVIIAVEVHEDDPGHPLRGVVVAGDLLPQEGFALPAVHVSGRGVCVGDELAHHRFVHDSLHRRGDHGAARHLHESPNKVSWSARAGRVFGMTASASVIPP